MKPSHKELARMYWQNDEGGLSSQAIGRMFGVDHSTVIKWLREFGIPVRAAGRRRRLPDKKELERLYVKEGLSTQEIATMFGCADPRVVGTALQKFGINTRRTGPKARTTCIEPNCNRPIYRVRHSNNRSLYGRRCRHHRELHYALLNRQIARRNRRIPCEKWRYQHEVPERAKKTKKYQRFTEEQCLKQARKELAAARSFLRRLGLSKSPNAGSQLDKTS